MAVIARYDFNDKGSTVADTATADGAQNGTYYNGAYASGGRARFDGQNDSAKFQSDAFQLSKGTIEMQFSLGSTSCDAQTLLSRDESGQTEGGFRIEIMPDQSILIVHEGAKDSTTYQTKAGFLKPGQEVKLSYSWDEQGGGRVLIENLATGKSFDADTPSGLTMDMGCESSKLILGDGISGGKHGYSNNDNFHGSVEYLQISNSVDNTDDCEPSADGIVSGTHGDDLIDVSYTGDPDGDRIDNNDAILPHARPNDDVVKAGDGNDTVIAGYGDDLIYGGNGNDLLFGGKGWDTLYGGAGNDTLDGGEDGRSDLYGGDGRDVFIASLGDKIDGGSGGKHDDFDTLRLGRAIPPGGTYELCDVIKDKDGNSISGVAIIRDTHGKEVGRVHFKEIEDIVPCFTPGTMIATPRGEVPVETLQPGDKVVTRDNGIQEIAWSGTKHLDWGALNANPHLKPVLIQQGSLGNGLPERDLVVSPNHRVLVANDRTALYFEEHEVLVSAKHLVAGRGIQSLDSAGVTYIHFMFARHEVVLTNGAWTESFQPGDYSLKGVGNSQRSEIFDIFPSLRTAQGRTDYTAARRTLRRHEARILAGH